MHVIEIDNGVTGYQQVVQYVLAHGVHRAPRGHVTIDAGPLTVIMHDINHALPLGVGRGINRRIAAAEAIQLIGEFSTPALLLNASVNFAKYIETDGMFHGAYGIRVHDQFKHVVAKLMNDVHTRQAVITLWNPQLDNLIGKRDYPCTVMLYFTLINNKLELTVVMRSQDVWLGTPFDWFQFTQAQHTIARVLAVRPGPYRHITLSTHIYEEHFERAQNLSESPHRDAWEWQPAGIGQRGDTIDDVIECARSIARYEDRAQPDEYTMSERWYAEQITPLLG